MEGCGEEAAEQAVDCLRQLPFVREILQEEPFLLRLRADGGEAESRQALQELVSRGIPVCDFHRVPMNLEKVFMEVTGDA